MYNDGYECRVYRPVAGTLNILGGTENTSMANMLLSHKYPHNPRPGQDIVKIAEGDLDQVIEGVTRGGTGSMVEAYKDNNKAKERVRLHGRRSNN